LNTKATCIEIKTQVAFFVKPCQEEGFSVSQKCEVLVFSKMQTALA
jgi:hypothetical protein